MFLLDLLYPVTCVVCKTPGDYICNECKKNIKVHDEVCPVCHKLSPDWLVCVGCSSKKNQVEGVIIGFVYTDAIKTLILYLKFQHVYHVSYFLAKLLSYIIISHEFLYKKIQKESLIITYVPSHRTRKYRVKGYNQSEKLAKDMGKILNCSVMSMAKKVRFTRSQTKLNRVKRKTNLVGVFKTKTLKNLRGNTTILIIDDITTTGSTILQVAKTIKKTHPNSSIRGAVIARSKPH